MPSPLLGSMPALLPVVERPSLPWTIGQLLPATVLRLESAHTVRVAISGRELTAYTPASLRPGEQLALRVSSLGMQPLLHVVSTSSAVSPAEGTGGRVAVAGPIDPLQPLLNSLRWLAEGEALLVRRLPQAVRDLAQEVLSAVRRADTLIVPGVLRQALGGAGLLLEARLARIPPGLTTATSETELDLKGRLLRLRSVLRHHGHLLLSSGVASQPAGGSASVAEGLAQPESLALSVVFLSRLLSTIDATLQGIEVRQLRSAIGSLGQGFAWHVQLPVLWDERVRTVEVVIERDGKRSHLAQPAVWRACLTLAPDGLGVIHARLTLAEQGVTVSFWATHGATQARLSAQMDKLKKGLTDAGLSVISLRCEQGMPSDGIPRGGCAIQLCV
ncbi:MAG: flagellar hook-length control protein FliK [Gammaproteobacteria bacterium]